MPSLVPVTHISNRGEPIDQYKRSSSGPGQYDADLELAKKLQAEFDSQPSSTPAASNSNPSAAAYSAAKYTSSPFVSASGKSGQQECPICQVRVAIADLEAHVEQHFEDDEAKRTSLKPGEKPISKSEAKAGFLAKLFGPKDPADDKKPTNTETPAAPTPASTPTPTQPAAVPYTHTYNQQRMPAGYYPNMGAPSQAAMYRPGYYPYPTQGGVPMRPQGAQAQQYLYYPNLDQPPQ